MMSVNQYPQERSVDAIASTERIQIPGINDAVVAAARIRNCEYPECERLTGSLHGGILIPYYDINGQSVMDEGGPYYRLRLDQERGDQKYHQRANTRTHGYIPPGFAQRAPNFRSLVVIEGEKKALALTSETVLAMGVSGFYGLFDGKDGFTDEFVQCLELVKPESLCFVGDADVIFNPQFADAVAKLVETLPKTQWAGLQVFIACVPPDAPGKGVDDVRAILGDEFRKWLEVLWEQTILVTPEMTKGRIVLRLLKQHRHALEKLARSDEKKDSIFHGLAKLTAGLADNFAEQEIREIANDLGFAKRFFGQAVTKAKTQLRNQAGAVLEGTGVTVDLARPAGEWAVTILRALPDEVYFSGDGKLSRLMSRELVPFLEKELISYLDRHDRFIFVNGGVEGQCDRTAKFEKKHAEILMGAAVNYPELLRRVRIFSKSPVLLDGGDGGCSLVTGYCRQSEILVSSHDHIIGNIPLDIAWAQIEKLLSDFQFESSADKAVALALLLTPILVKGGFLKGKRAPFIIIWKDQKGAGGGYLCQVVCGVHGHRSKAITVRDPFRVYESISRSLFNGDSIIYLDNVRGAVLADLPFLESLLTEPVFDARMIYRHGELDVDHLTLMASSNGMTLSEDLADRAVEIRIRKQPSSYSFREWEEGDLLSHIERNHQHYLFCLHTIIQSWVAVGRPLAKAVSGIRFKEWERVIGGILNMRPEAPLNMFPGGEAGRRRMMDRMSSPDFERIAALCADLIQRGVSGQWLTCRQMAELTDDKVTDNSDEQGRIAQQIGIMLADFCPVVGQLKDVGEHYKIQRQKRNIPEKNYKATNEYCILESSQMSDSVTSLNPGTAA